MLIQGSPKISGHLNNFWIVRDIGLKFIGIQWDHKIYHWTSKILTLTFPGGRGRRRPENLKWCVEWGLVWKNFLRQTTRTDRDLYDFFRKVMIIWTLLFRCMELESYSTAGIIQLFNATYPDRDLISKSTVSEKPI